MVLPVEFDSAVSLCPRICAGAQYEAGKLDVGKGVGIESAHSQALRPLQACWQRNQRPLRDVVLKEHVHGIRFQTAHDDIRLAILIHVRDLHVVDMMPGKVLSDRNRVPG